VEIIKCLKLWKSIRKVQHEKPKNLKLEKQVTTKKIMKKIIKMKNYLIRGPMNNKSNTLVKQPRNWGTTSLKTAEEAGIQIDESIKSEYWS